jgi:XTP/dITP diphosphohydrolase
MEILIASNNRGKLEEIRALLKDLPLTLIIPADIHLDLDVEERGLTYAENAALKAAAFADATGLISLADDSGLEVDALNGAPGLHSARFSPHPHATDADRRRRLLDALRECPPPWLARFRCTVAIASHDPGTEIQFTEGICEGEIIPEERGQRGFGYDPIFLIPEFGKTMAELTLEEKNRVSHRARAIFAARPRLLTMLQGPPA